MARNTIFIFGGAIGDALLSVQLARSLEAPRREGMANRFLPAQLVEALERLREKVDRELVR